MGVFHFRPRTTRRQIAARLGRRGVRAGVGTSAMMVAANRVRPGRKFKRGARVATRTRKVPRSKIQRDGPVSESLVVYPYKKQVHLSKDVKQILGEQWMVNNDIARLTHAVNAQATTVLPGMFNALDVSNIMNLSAGIVNTSGANVNWKVLLESCNAKLMITNQTSDIVRITLYDCLPRRDINNATYTPPNNAWVNGDATASGGTGAFAYVGSTPFQTPAFTRLYKVVKVTTLDLHTGGHHIHRIEGKPNLSFDKNTSVEVGTASGSGFRALTGFTMIVQHGYPTNDGTTKTNVGLANGAVDYVMTRQYRYRVLEASVASLGQIATNLLNPGTEAIFNDLTGASTVVSTV